MKSLTWPVLIALLLDSGVGACYAFGQLQSEQITVVSALRTSGLQPNQNMHAAAQGHAR